MIDKTYTNELKIVLTIAEKDVIDLYPSKKITVDHVLTSMLTISDKCNAYKILKRITGVGVLKIGDFYAEKLHEKTKLAQLNKNNQKTTSYDEEFSKVLINSDFERAKLKNTKIGSEHILLTMLRLDTNTINNLTTFGVTYESVICELKKIKEENEHHKENQINLASEIGGGLGLQTTKQKKYIETYCTNLNKLTQQGKTGNIVGRDTEINKLTRVLCRKNKNSAIIVGLGGVGKTSLVFSLANTIENNENHYLSGKIILQLNTTALIAGTMYRGVIEDRFNGLINEIKANGNYILFIDNIHTIIGSNTQQASSEVSGLLLNTLSRGDVQIISTTTFKEYKNTIENNIGLSSLLQKIILEPTSIDETQNILLQIKNDYEKYHGVIYDDDAIKMCITLANKYINNKQLPDSAIDVMDEAGSSKKISTITTHHNKLKKLRETYLKIDNERKNKIKLSDFKTSDKLKSKLSLIETEIIDTQKKIKYTKKNKTIKQIDIYKTISEITGIPISKLSINEKQKYINIESKLNCSVIGQEHAIKTITQSIKRNKIGLERKNKPQGSFLCVGMSGVGKTMLAKKIAEELYDNQNNLIRLDMSEYSDKTSVNKIYGSSPGYVGFENGGQLTEAVKNKKHGVLLLDEIEKADKEVLNTFLQVLDDGVLTDNIGQKVYFNNFIILMTSNVGATESEQFSKGSGFIQNTDDNRKNISEKALRRHFPPEFINRLDGVIYFNNLTDDNIRDIIKIELKKLEGNLKNINCFIEYDSNDLIEYLLSKIKENKNSGARRVGRIIQNEIENNICDLLLSNNIDKPYTYIITVQNNGILKFFEK